MFDKLKGLNPAQAKLAYQLAKEKITVEAGNGAVEVTVNGAMQVQSVRLNRELIDLDDLDKLEKWLESAYNQAIKRSMEAMAEKAQQSGLAG